MSKEKQCECCHEWWYDSDVKENLCPNCYDYFKQLKQQLAEKDKEIAHLKEKDNYHLRYELAGADETITNLKQQLEEKDKEIEKLKTKQKPIVMHSKENYYFLEEENIKLHFAQKQLAIQELEKVENFILENTMLETETAAVLAYIYQQIKELKGEKQ